MNIYGWIKQNFWRNLLRPVGNCDFIWEVLTFRSPSSLPEASAESSLVTEELTGWCRWLSVASSCLCLLNLSTNRESLERLARITSLAGVLLLELISKIVYNKTKGGVFTQQESIRKLYSKIFISNSLIWICSPWWRRLFEDAPVPFFPNLTLKQDAMKCCYSYCLSITITIFFTVHHPPNWPSNGWTAMLNRSVLLTRLMDSAEGFGRDLRYCLYAFSETRCRFCKSREFSWAVIRCDPSSSRILWGTRPNTPSESGEKQKVIKQHRYR